MSIHLDQQFNSVKKPRVKVFKDSFLKKGSDGSEELIISPTLSNILAILKAWNMTASVELMSRELILTGGDDWVIDDRLSGPRSEPYDSLELFATSVREVAKIEGLTMRRCDIIELLLLIIKESKSHAVKSWVDSLAPWDGVNRIKPFLDAIHLYDETLNNYKDEAIVTWLMNIKACINWSPADKLDNMPVLVFSGGQGVGKTTWAENLMPANLSAVGTGISLNLESQSVDSRRESTRFLIVELGELEHTFKKSSIAALKSFISNPYDLYREPYAKSAVSRPRRTVFFGTVNDEKFLADDESRRFIVLHIKSLDHSEQANRDQGQFWAQIMQMDKSRTFSDSMKKQQFSQNKKHNQDDPTYERVSLNFTPAQPDDVMAQFMSSGMVADILGYRVDDITGSRKIAKALKELTGESSNLKSIKGRKIKGWWLIDNSRGSNHE